MGSLIGTWRQQGRNTAQWVGGLSVERRSTGAQRQSLCDGSPNQVNPPMHLSHW